MARKNDTPERTEKGNHKKFSGWKKVVTAFALASSLSACDMPNNEVKLNPENQSAEFKVEYQYYRWASDIEIVDYYVTVQKKMRYLCWRDKWKKWMEWWKNYSWIW